MRAHTFLCLAATALACADAPAVPAGPDTPTLEVRPVTGRWVGTAGTGAHVDVTLTEIRGDVGGSGRVTLDGQGVDVAVEGSHEGRDITLRLRAGSRGWDFRGTVGDGTRRMNGGWTTFGVTAALSLVRCGTTAGCP